MQVQPFIPLRTVVTVPLASIAMIDALWAMDAGAADSALLTGSLEDAEAVSLVFAVAAELSTAFPPVAGLLHALSVSRAALAPNQTKSPDDVIGPSFRSEGRAA
jgi:hypothetical protein